VPKIRLKRLPMTREEVEDMISRADNERDRALIAMLYITGARISEVLRLKRKDIEIGEKEVRITITPLKIRSKGPLIFVHTLPIPLTAPFVEHIVSYVSKIQDGEEFLFCGYKKPMTRVRAWQIIKKLNQDTFPHFFRHTRASKLAEAGADVLEIKEWLGRKTLPLEYISVSRRRIAALARRLT